MLLAQQQGDRKFEREIKISGNYYYGDGLAPTEDEAATLAIEELKMMITESVLESNSSITEVNFQGFEDNIGTITIPLEGRYRVISFLLKKEVQFNPSGEKRLMVVRLLPDGPAIEAISGVDMGYDANINSAQPTAEVAEPEKPEADITPAFVSTVEPITPVDEPAQKVDEQEAVSDKPAIALSNSNDIINGLLQINSSKEVGDYLNNNKNKGSLVYGQLKTLQDPSLCYFVILKDGKLVDVLDKTPLSSKKGLISGNSVDYRTITDTIYWIYLIEN